MGEHLKVRIIQCVLYTLGFIEFNPLILTLHMPDYVLQPSPGPDPQGPPRPARMARIVTSPPVSWHCTLDRSLDRFGFFVFYSPSCMNNDENRYFYKIWVLPHYNRDLSNTSLYITSE